MLCMASPSYVNQNFHLVSLEEQHLDTIWRLSFSAGLPELMLGCFNAVSAARGSHCLFPPGCSLCSPPLSGFWSGAALSVPSVEGFCSPLFCKLGLILASWESWGLMKKTETHCCKYSCLNFFPFSVYWNKWQKMYSPASPFPLGRPVLSAQLLGTSAFLQLSGLAWATLAAQEHQPARAPVPCGVPAPRAVPALCLWAWAVPGAFREFGWGRLHRHQIPFLYSCLCWILCHLASNCRMQKNTT